MRLPQQPLVCAKHQLLLAADQADTRHPPIPRCAQCVAQAKARVHIEKERFARINGGRHHGFKDQATESG